MADKYSPIPTREPATATNPSRPRTVVADDIPELLRCICLLVEDTGTGNVVGTASNGAEALSLALALKPELVLMDVNMPVLNGCAAAREIKQRMPKTRVVLMSAEDSEQMRLDAANSGADAFIRKAELITSAKGLLAEA